MSIQSLVFLPVKYIVLIFGTSVVCVCVICSAVILRFILTISPPIYHSDEITLTFNNRASVVSMAYVPLVSPLAPSCDEFAVTMSEDPKSFSSKISLETATPGMILPAVLPQTKPPAGLKFLKSKNGNKPNPLDPNEKEQPVTSPQGFLRKYWYLILPLFIMSMTSGAAPEEQQQPAQGAAASHPSQGGSGGGGQAAASAGAAAPTQSAPSGGGGTSATRRRGKRG